MVNNQGIMHAAHHRGGHPFCKQRNAHMSTTIDRFRLEPLQCKRCAARVEKMDALYRKRDERHYYTRKPNRHNLPVDIQSWDEIMTLTSGLVMIWLPRKMTEWECEHYGLTPCAPPPEEAFKAVPAPVVKTRVLVIHINVFNSQIIGGYLMVNGKKASAMLTVGEIGASIIENPKQRVDIQRV